ncbi:putative quinol monooxygenase [Brucella anthropi]|uniref:putative quinol monooxygenase n=1 Tax=Brucella anthropi TaxID=529 RepID=UPI001AED3B4A|nr:antibiotic biosynthesis monooxygenase [Brucella anthropi]
MSEVENTLTVVLWEAKAKPGREAEMKAFLTSAVTPSRHDVGCFDYEPHEVKGQPGTFVIYERWISKKRSMHISMRHECGN